MFLLLAKFYKLEKVILEVAKSGKKKEEKIAKFLYLVFIL
jgi:hypothetical protein